MSKNHHTHLTQVTNILEIIRQWSNGIQEWRRIDKTCWDTSQIGSLITIAELK